MRAPIAVFALTVAAVAQQNPSTMKKIGTVDVRFQSYNVEMVEVTGGRFWKPYSSTAAAAPVASAGATPGGIDPSLFEQRKPIDLYNPKLRKLAAALGPAYVRVPGTWENTMYFQDLDATAPGATPEGFGGVLTRAQWKGVVDFSRAVDAKIVTSFATSAGTRDAAGVWTPAEARKFMAYDKSLGGNIAAAEFMNEPTFASAAGVPNGYDGTAYGRDFLVFQRFFREAAPRAILLGPGSVGEGIDMVVPGRLLPSKDLMAASGPNPVDAFSYHYYGSVSSRCSRLGAAGTTPDAALSEDWLRRTDTVEAFYAKLHDEYAPGKPIWLTETGQTACGGDRWASTFTDSFRYVDQMGSLARRGVQVIAHNTLAASDYALIDEATLMPRPNFWAALLWHRTMGTTVFDAGSAKAAKVHVYAQCMKGKGGGVTVVALNVDREAAQEIEIAGKSTRYTLTAPELMSRSVELNGKAMGLAANGDVPKLVGVSAAGGKVSLPAASISFFTVAGAGNSACR